MQTGVGIRSGVRNFWIMQDVNYNVMGVLSDGPASVGPRLVERQEYTPYGRRTVFSHGFLAADFNGDGTVNDADATVYYDNSGSSGVRWFEGDGNEDGTVDSADYTVWADQYGDSVPTSAGNDPYVMQPRLESFRGYWPSGDDKPSLCDVGHQGLLYDREIDGYYNRMRMYLPRVGRFAQRDPIGYADGMSLYQYVGGRPLLFVDPLGLFRIPLKDGKELEIKRVELTDEGDHYMLTITYAIWHEHGGSQHVISQRIPKFENACCPNQEEGETGQDEGDNTADADAPGQAPEVDNGVPDTAGEVIGDAIDRVISPDTVRAAARQVSEELPSSDGPHIPRQMPVDASSTGARRRVAEVSNVQRPVDALTVSGDDLVFRSVAGEASGALLEVTLGAVEMLEQMSTDGSPCNSWLKEVIPALQRLDCRSGALSADGVYSTSAQLCQESLEGDANPLGRGAWARQFNEAVAELRMSCQAARRDQCD